MAKEHKDRTVLDLVRKARKTHHRAGTRKLMKYIENGLMENNIKMGRDALFDLLRCYGMLVKKTKRYHITTDSKHLFYKSPNLIKDMEITHSEQVFVSDITYIKTDDGHAYLALVTDAYSKKLMGWALDDNMRATLVVQALDMAIKNLYFRPKGIIHHSDRGIQYCCPEFTDFAEKNNFKLSTTQQYDPYENAVAERINGILKYEFGLKRTIKNVAIARQIMKQAVQIYNRQRIHWSLGLETPEYIHKKYDSIKYKSYKKKTA
jgi:transposase InsO family protein